LAQVDGLDDNDNLRYCRYPYQGEKPPISFGAYTGGS